MKIQGTYRTQGTQEMKDRKHGGATRKEHKKTQIV